MITVSGIAAASQRATVTATISTACSLPIYRERADRTRAERPFRKLYGDRSRDGGDCRAFQRFAP